MVKKTKAGKTNYEELDKVFTADTEPYEWLVKHGFKPMYPNHGGLVEKYVYEIMDDFDKGPHRIGVVYVAPPADNPYFRKQPKDMWMAEVEQTLMVTFGRVQQLSKPANDPRDCLVDLLFYISYLKTEVRKVTNGVLPDLTDNSFGI
jgi:hypothetical protein